jgi:hypothetical protein
MEMIKELTDELITHCDKIGIDIINILKLKKKIYFN